MQRLLAASEENNAVKGTVAEVELQYNIANWQISRIHSKRNKFRTAIIVSIIIELSQ
jgi:hypothetical protein